MNPAKLLKVLGEPGTGAPLKCIVTHQANGIPYKGWLFNGKNLPVGKLDEFKFFFVNSGVLPNYEEVVNVEPTEVSLLRQEITSIHSDRFKFVGEWETLSDYLKVNHGDKVNAHCSIVSNKRKVTLCFHAHQWSGISRITVNGELYQEIDLFNLETALPRKVTIDNPKEEDLKIIIEPLCKARDEALGRQLIIESIIEELDTYETPVFSKGNVVNKGGEFHSRFFEYLKNLPESAVVLDVGGGKRQLDDPRYLNLEYSLYEEPDLYGDALSLPFKDNSIDLLYSGAVLEHVEDPVKAGKEMFRVLKPGGRVLSGVAFMQPIHSDGQHFFNSTIYGIEKIFENFDIEESWWDGSFSDTVKWMAEAAGIDHKAPSDQWDEFLKIIASLDSYVSYEGLKYIAGGVWCDALKPYE